MSLTTANHQATTTHTVDNITGESESAVIRLNSMRCTEISWQVFGRWGDAESAQVQASLDGSSWAAIATAENDTIGRLPFIPNYLRAKVNNTTQDSDLTFVFNIR